MRCVRVVGFLTHGSSVTSLSRGVRWGLTVPLLVVPGFFAYKLSLQTDGRAAMACWFGLVVFGVPLLAILPALRAPQEYADRAEETRRRIEGDRSVVRALEKSGVPPESSWSTRPTPPTRW